MSVTSNRNGNFLLENLIAPIIAFQKSSLFLSYVNFIELFFFVLLSFRPQPSQVHVEQTNWKCSMCEFNFYVLPFLSLFRSLSFSCPPLSFSLLHSFLIFFRRFLVFPITIFKTVKKEEEGCGRLAAAELQLIYKCTYLCR